MINNHFFSKIYGLFLEFTEFGQITPAQNSIFGKFIWSICRNPGPFSKLGLFMKNGKEFVNCTLFQCSVTYNRQSTINSVHNVKTYLREKLKVSWTFHFDSFVFDFPCEAHDDGLHQGDPWIGNVLATHPNFLLALIGYEMIFSCLKAKSINPY